MTIKQTKIGWGFWLKWVLFTTIGFFIIILVGFVLFSDGILSRMIGDIADDFFFYQFAEIMMFILVGAVVGIIQWLILRRRVSQVGWWAPAIVAGLVFASVLLYALPVARNYFLEVENIFAFRLGFIMLWSLGGTLASVFQWFFLRRQISLSGWWVLASAVGWSLGAVVWELSNWFLFERFGFGPGGLLEFLQILNAFGLFFGIIMGAVTGGAIVWLLRQPVNVK